MRITTLLLVTMIVTSIAASSEAATEKAKQPVFGRGYCKPVFPCADISNSDAARVVTQKITAIAERCVRGDLGMHSADGFIETSFGLDSSLCLTTKDIPRSSNGLTMSPKCCVKPTDNSGTNCQVVCTKFGAK